MKCPLCKSLEFKPRHHQAWKEDDRFRECLSCESIYVHEKYFLNPAQEQERYLKHHNELNDEMRKYLSPTRELVQRLAQKGARILDFGSGPQPTLGCLLQEGGYSVTFYDPYFFAKEIEGVFDLIVLHEVFEHLYRPRNVLSDLRRRLGDHGKILVVMQSLSAAADFSTWWYARDATHVHFASSQGLKIMAKELGLEVVQRTPVAWIFSIQVDQLFDRS